ncbi:BRCT domain-containing protein [Prunus yedoensis var. nudiflora]|uniref:BRCT domain-containing protein n=1 Tax=Prunus yedoensis var. nudiflora TaxID=2094558 RepID=A0A314Z1H8_PRUYE|nr:BRCT domain-containing protein [Prunus yedoensis var. nudiflora]
MDLSYGCSKSQKMNHDAEAGIICSPSSSDKSPKVKPTSMVDVHMRLLAIMSLEMMTALWIRLVLSYAGISPTKSSTVIRKPLACDLPFSATVTSETAEDGNGNKKTPLTTFQRLRKSSLSSKPGIVDCVVEKLTFADSKTVELQNQHQDVEGDHGKSPGAMKLDMLYPGAAAEPPKEVEGKDVTMTADVAENNIQSMDAETEAPEEESEHKLKNVLHEAKAIGVQSTSKCVTTKEKSEGMQQISDHSDACVHGDAMASAENTDGNERETTVSDRISLLVESSSEGDGVKGKKNKGKKRDLGKTKFKAVPAVADVMKPKKFVSEEDTQMRILGRHRRNWKKYTAEQQAGKATVKSNITPLKINQTSVEISPNSSIPEGKAPSNVKTEPVWFILSGTKFQRKDFRQVIRCLKGRCCRDSHHWSYQATHFIAPGPIKRTEKFFAATASGRWILRSDYLAASNQAGRFLAEEPYEWHQNGLSEDGAINLEAPRKWRVLRERTGHGAFHGMRIIIYGECIAPPLDTLKRVVKAGDGTNSGNLSSLHSIPRLGG